MANGQVPQPPPVGGPTPQLQPPPLNVAQILGQLSATPPAGPIPVTPYAPANVGPLAMPGAGLAGASGKPPPWTGPPKGQQQPQFGQPSVGSLMQPGTTGGGAPLGDRNSGLAPGAIPALQTPYAQRVFQQLLGQSPMPNVMRQPVNVPQQPQALQSLLPRPNTPAPTTAPRPTVSGQINPLTGMPMTYQLGQGAPRNM